MAGIRNSRRARETRLSIEKSLLTLLTDKELTQITVKAICQQADINRGTFYIHYQDVQDCFDQIVRDFTQQILELAEKFQRGASESAGFMELLQIIKDQPLTAHYILNTNDILSKILAKIQSAVIEKVYDKLDWYTNIYYVSGIVGVIQEWVNTGEKQSAAEITNILLSVLHGHTKNDRNRQRETNIKISLDNY